MGFFLEKLEYVHFAISENNLNMASRKIANTQTLILQWKYNITSLPLNCLKIQCWDHTKHIKETDSMVARGHEI